MSNKKIGLLSLTALVLSSMIGSGIFSLPQNMAQVASGQALLIVWLITGVGIIFLGLSFFISRLRPELDSGVYTYAREGFGDLAGFMSAWGYWLCATIGIVGYLVVAFEGVGQFTNSNTFTLFGQGNTVPTFIGSSVIVWLIYILITKEVKEASTVNLVATFVKVFPLVLFIGLAIWYFSPAKFSQDMTGRALGNSTLDQVKNTMLITLWVFTGVESASILSAHAKKKSDVGLATVLSLIIALALYVAITVLSYGVLPRETIAQMANPSMAELLSHMTGDVGKVIITACLIVSVLASYISWTMYSAEVPYRGLKNGAFPKNPRQGQCQRHAHQLAVVHRACSADVSFFGANDRQKLQRPTTYLNVHDFSALFFDWGVSVEAVAYRAFGLVCQINGATGKFLWAVDYLCRRA